MGNQKQEQKAKPRGLLAKGKQQGKACKNHHLSCLFTGLFVLSYIFTWSCARAQSPLRYSIGQTELQVPAEKSGRLKVRVTLVNPKGPIHGNLLVLPGWKFHRHRWLKETRLVALADKYGLLLICPEMHTSVYASRYFPQTRMKWNPVSGLAWIRDFLIPFFQEKNILLKKQKNYLLGLSTGGRGVALLALELPGLFRAAAAFSGDYDQSQMPKDRLMAAVYGPFVKFQKRWKTIDNPMSRVSEWNLPVYLAHGTQDRVVPFSQTRLFYNAIQKRHPNLRIALSAPKAGHNFRFWDSELPKALRFLLHHP